jgi:hypothetical protein
LPLLDDAYLLQADTPYMYSTYDGPCESAPTTGRKVLILGGGPNRIGQGIEFDYCCCHASFALRYVNVLGGITTELFIHWYSKEASLGDGRHVR